MDAMQYLGDSSRTVAGNYYSDLVTTSEMDYLLQAIIASGQWADRVKRALFYGKQMEAGRTWSTTSLQHKPDLADLVHAMLGCVTESAEMAEHMRDVLTGAKPLDRVNLIEEIGDFEWYVALGLRFLDATHGEAWDKNIAKLRKRFPDKFSESDALNRDLGAERAVLEQNIKSFDADPIGYASAQAFPKAQEPPAVPETSAEYRVLEAAKAWYEARQQVKAAHRALAFAINEARAC